MRRPLIAGNWKMNLYRQQAVELAAGVSERIEGVSSVDMLVCPPSVYLDAVSQVISDSRIELGAQNMHFEHNGAFTGEISAAMLVDLGCRYVILGHSERRHGMGETDEEVHRKAQSALEAGLHPLVCVGELLEEREADRTGQVISTQFSGSLAGLTEEQILETVLAYEPVWAIGTGKVATPAEAQQVHLHLRKLLEERYNAEVAQSVRILYGGSVKPDNAGELLNQPDIDGALVGGASLKVNDFVGIVQAAGA